MNTPISGQIFTDGNGTRIRIESVNTINGFTLLETVDAANANDMSACGDELTLDEWHTISAQLNLHLEE